MSIAFTLDYLTLLVCFCTATWQYDTFTFWLETNSAQTPGWKPKNNDGIATDEQQSPLQKPVREEMGGKTQKKENKKEKKAMNGRGKKTLHKKMAEQEKI